MKVDLSVILLGNDYGVEIEKLAGSKKFRASGSVKADTVQVECRGYNAALSGWRLAAAKKLKV
jgi:hypothetical protein